MPSKQKSNNGLNNPPPLKPLGSKSGRSKGWQKYLQSNAVKAGLAGVLVLLLVIIIAWQLISGGGGGTKTIPTVSSSESNQGQGAPLPPPVTQAPEVTPASPDQIDASANPNGQSGQEGNQDQNAETQPNGTQAEQAQTGDVRPETSRGVSPGGEIPAVPPQLPDDVSNWSKADFARARQENSPKLIEAVTFLGEKFPGSVPVAQQLAELLKSPKPAEEDNSFRRVTTFGVPGFIEVTMIALGKNGSPAARQTLMQVLNGKVTTDNDQEAVDAVLRTLILIPSAENDDILVKVLISPSDFRPATVISTQQMTMQPNELRMKALELVRQGASENLCIKLAENIVQKGFEPADSIATFLLEDNPANLGAQLVLYQSEDLTADIKTRLEQYFLNYGSQAIGLTMGIPSGTDGATSTMPGSTRGGLLPGGRDRMPPGVMPHTGAVPSDVLRERISDYDRGVHLAKQLWGEPLASLMSERLNDVRTLERSAPEIVLASTLPLESIHAAMYKMLKKRAANEGPMQLESAGWTTDRVLIDPGLLVLLKMLPRSKAIKTAPIGGVGAASTRTNPRAYSPRRPTGIDAGGAMGQPTRSEAAQRKEQIEMGWMLTISKMVESWCTRLEMASQAQKRAARRGQKVFESQPTRMDEFELPQDAKVLAAYQLNWPEKAPADMGKVKPAALKIQYFRLQQTGMLKKTMAAFKRQAKGGDVHEMSNGQWLETIKNGSQPNTKRSLDIFVTSADGQPVDLTLTKEETIDLEIDILAFEIADPGAAKD